MSGLEYYYGMESEQFHFFRVPKLLFADPRFKHVSVDAKVLYGLMLDRMSLSRKNGWYDKQGRVYIFFTLEDAVELLGYGQAKVVKLFAELDTDKGIGLIERKKQGQGKPTIIYVKNFVAVASIQSDSDIHTEQNSLCESESLKPTETEYPDLSKTEVQTYENHKSALLEIESPDLSKAVTNNTDISDTDLNDTNLSICREPIRETEDQIDRIDSYKLYRQIVKENISYDTVFQGQYFDKRLDEMLEIMVETLCSTKEQVWINGEYLPAELVKSRLLKLNELHIQYVLESFDSTTKEIRNMKAYMLTALYNAPLTMHSSYAARVNHDMHEGRL